MAELDRKLARGKHMFLNGLIEMAEFETLVADLKGRKQTIETKLPAIDEPLEVSLHPAMAQAYAALAGRLHAAMDSERGEKVRTELRALIERVDFQPVEGLGKFELQVHGKLKALLGMSERAEAGSNCGVGVGAGTGFEPVTFRL